MSSIFDHLQQSFISDRSINRANTTPIHFNNFDQDVEVQGVKLKRFRMAPDTFTSARADAKVRCVYCNWWIDGGGRTFNRLHAFIRINNP